MGTIALRRSCGDYRLGMFVLHCSCRVFAWEFVFPLGIFRLEIVAWIFSFGNFRLGSFARELQFGSFRLRVVALEL